MQKSTAASSTFTPSERNGTLRSRVFRVLETAQDQDLASRCVDVFLITLISASVLAVILESVAGFENRFGDELALFEAFTVAAFTIEYLLRLWSSIEASPESAQHPIVTRLRYAVSFHAIIDLLAILPFYLLLFGVFGSVDMRVLRAVRLLRVLKLTRYSAALNMLFMTFRENGRALAAAFLILLTVMLLAASGMYYFERESQPEDFGSIPAAMWWAFATLTTVGYGDVTPITAGGKIFGALITVVGIGMVALPTSILATGYSRQLDQSTSDYSAEADRALDDGILTDKEISDLEVLRIDLGLSKHNASQILDAGRVKRALARANTCPHCLQTMPPEV
ncbi:MAG: ion transporter [Gammaproteobacteria bacterium]|nr:ion transporter [Gammaproteobacteria bacterium]